MPLRFIYQYPETTGSHGDMLDAGPVAELAARAEAAGWNGFAFTEHPAPGTKWLESGGHQSLDPFVALGHVAAITTRLKLVTFLTVLPYRNPLLVAKAAATVDRLSSGRFVLGVGTGYLKAEFHALGVNFDERNDLVDEALDVLPLYWSGQPFDFTGRHFSARQIVGLPRPAQDPIPIWIGGNSSLARRRVARRAQGWMPLIGAVDMAATIRTPWIHSIEDLERRIQSLREEAGERADGLDVGVAYTDPTVAQPDVDVERHRDTLGRLGEIGVTWIILPGTSGRYPATAELMESFAQHYIMASGSR
ncbi:MAG TPA: LLM class F420-dependent oxidoreductase [Acidimicrobiales bacterium]